MVKKDNNNSNTTIFGIKEDDCDRPACDDMISMLRQAQKHHVATTTKSSSSKNNEEQQQQEQQPKKKNDQRHDDVVVVGCPPNSAELGRSSWTLLHTMAAWYPMKPTKEERNNMIQFIQTLSQYYPCTYCATDFQESIQKKPIQASSREDLCIWLCEQHNIVNEKLGKVPFSCDMKHLDDRWRKSNRDECN